MSERKKILNNNYLINNGWIKVKLNNSKKSALHHAHVSILKFLKKLIPTLTCLEEYHKYIMSDNDHLEVQVLVSDYFQNKNFIYDIVYENLSNLTPFIGLDLMLQKKPYLRIARPMKIIDNIGFHRDTSYGSSPYELSLSIPLCNITKMGSLSVISKSHRWPDIDLNSKFIDSDRVTKNSKLHKLGFPYSPIIIPNTITRQANPIHTKFGEGLLFSLSLIHGQEVNKSRFTRFQTDVRLVNSLAVFNNHRSSAAEYYEQLIETPATYNARYFQAINTN